MVTAGEVMHSSLIERLAPVVLQRNVSSIGGPDFLRYIQAVHDAMASGTSLYGAKTNSNPAIAVRAVGLKLMYHQVPGLTGKVTDQAALSNLVQYAAQEQVVIIHLYRLNLLERYISLEAIKQTNLAYHLDSGLPSNFSFGGSGVDAKIELDVRAASQFVKAQIRSSSKLQQYLDEQCATNGLTCLTVAFEHLTGRKAETERYFAKLRQAVGISSVCGTKQKGPSAAHRSQQSIRMSWIPCANRVSNWAAIAENDFFDGSIWLKMCNNNNQIPSSWHTIWDDASQNDANMLHLQLAFLLKAELSALHRYKELGIVANTPRPRDRTIQKKIRRRQHRHRESRVV